ncbi:lipopolysaccharide assembly protein [Anseongella ginsenosidimutans]|uniref:Lipopolysaccharide assembly protein n=1 Tax=Anseongella ginsenosidimutans TaxID=496056 RepID=A0A4V2UUB2_9SPHI|nr:LptE family protein [Anseongella ginsenosidimutans]QEC51314.1 hypothetical protein FRZ59_02405 [Anseongella ginsenosidimutans]TCS89993.1 lipopolysaccharide assembly protein [Anseongella ginsenosidimutans]
MKFIKNTCLLLLPLFFMYGCYSFSGASISPDMKTCSVLLFQSRAPLAPPSLSSQLTEALKQKIINQTALSLSNGGGDAVFEGTVTGFTVQPVALTGGETAELNRLNVSISVKYTNALDPKQSFESSFTRYRDFPAGQNLQTVQNGLIEEIMPELVDDIFNRAFVNW